MNPAPFESRFTGIFRSFNTRRRRAHEPAVSTWAGAGRVAGADGELAAGGAGFEGAEARNACIGEAIERLRPAPLRQDAAIEASFASWPLDEPALAPGSAVLFHEEQYRQPGFPFEPWEPETACAWTAFRELPSGDPVWAPEEMAFLMPRRGRRHRFAPGTSTGLSCGRSPGEAIRRGIEETIERDALVGAWWGRYALEEWPAEAAIGALGGGAGERVLRPNLRYRAFRIASPFSDHVTLVTVEGEDREGYVFSAGSACRASRAASWTKAVLEALQGRAYAAFLLEEIRRGERALSPAPADFAESAVFYSVHPERLADTALARASPPARGGRDAARESGVETLAALVARLGPERRVLFRHLTPPEARLSETPLFVFRVLATGLQPLHGDHRLPHLGGSLWAPRRLADWAAMPPHPFA
jgi:ribosomal protein S12 methylthiotransferase accessory factor